MFNTGDKVKFKEERQRYTVQAVGIRYAVCTKPFNPKKTVLYSIVDFKEGIRGTENLIFCRGFETPELCQEALQDLETGQTDISRRNYTQLNIERVDHA